MADGAGRELLLLLPSPGIAAHLADGGGGRGRDQQCAGTSAGGSRRRLTARMTAAHHHDVAAELLGGGMSCGAQGSPPHEPGWPDSDGQQQNNNCDPVSAARASVALCTIPDWHSECDPCLWSETGAARAECHVHTSTTGFQRFRFSFKMWSGATFDFQ